MPYPLPPTRTEAYLAYKAGVIQQSDLKPSLAVPRNGIDAWLAYWTGLAADYPKREDGTPHILQEEEAYIAYLCGVINEYPEKCLRRVGAYLRYLISARWGRPDHPLNREELYLSLIKTQFIPSGDPSSDIVIDGTAKAPFVDVKMYGDTFQQTYTGKNLYDYVNAGYPVIRSGIEATLNADGSITVTGVPTSSYVRIVEHDMIDELEDGATYTLSSDSYSADLYIDVAATRVGGGTAYPANTRNGAASFTVNKSSFSQYRISILTYTTESWGSDSKTIIRNFQLEKSASATPFEPYVGGQPSPSPEYSQPIQTVTGEQTVSVIGKNLFNKNAVTNGGYIDTNGEVVAWETFGYSEYVRVIGGQTYSYSGTANNVYYSAKAAWYDSNKNFISAFSFGQSGQVTAPATAKFLRTSVRIASPSGLDTYQLELGSTITTYEAYRATNYPISLGTIELCKIGTYQDYIWKDGEEWKIHKATAKAIFKDIEWHTARIGSTNHYRQESISIKTEVLIPTSNTKFIGACSGYTVVTAGETYGYPQKTGVAIQFAGYVTSGNICVYDPLYDAPNQADNFKAARANTEIYYALATPTDTVITDPNLIDQLNALKQGGAEDGTTYIKVSATDPNLPGLLYVEAAKYI